MVIEGTPAHVTFAYHSTYANWSIQWVYIKETKPKHQALCLAYFMIKSWLSLHEEYVACTNTTQDTLTERSNE